MMNETGRVVALEQGAVWVETERRGSCGSCAARSGCGHGLLSGYGVRPELVRARLGPGMAQDLALHDTVRISLPEQGFLRGVGLLYLLPLLGAVGAALLASSLGVRSLEPAAADLYSALAALAGLGCSFALVYWYSGRSERIAALHPVVTARL